MGVSSKVTAKPTTIDSYLKTISLNQRPILDKLREDIHAAAHGLEECISYGIPSFRWQGKLLVGFGAAKTHCAFYPGSIVRDFATELAGYNVGKGTIRFHPDQPLPKSLVKKIVKARIAQRAGG